MRPVAPVHGAVGGMGTTFELRRALHAEGLFQGGPAVLAGSP